MLIIFCEFQEPHVAIKDRMDEAPEAIKGNFLHLQDLFDQFIRKHLIGIQPQDLPMLAALLRETDLVPDGDPIVMDEWRSKGSSDLFGPVGTPRIHYDGLVSHSRRFFKRERKPSFFVLARVIHREADPFSPFVPPGPLYIQLGSFPRILLHQISLPVHRLLPRPGP